MSINDQFVKVECPSCEKRLKIPMMKTHRKINCPYCKVIFRFSVPNPAYDQRDQLIDGNDSGSQEGVRVYLPNSGSSESGSQNPSSKDASKKGMAGETIFDQNYEDMFDARTGSSIANQQPRSPVKPEAPAKKPAPTEVSEDYLIPEELRKGNDAHRAGPTNQDLGDRVEDPRGSYKPDFDGTIRYKLAPTSKNEAVSDLYHKAKMYEDESERRRKSADVDERLSIFGIVLLLVSVAACLASALGVFPQLSVILAVGGMIGGLCGAALLTLSRQQDGIVATLVGAVFGVAIVALGAGSLYLNSMTDEPVADASTSEIEEERVDPIAAHMRELEEIAERNRLKAEAERARNSLPPRNQPPQDIVENVDEQAKEMPSLDKNPFRKQSGFSRPPQNPFASSKQEPNLVETDEPGFNEIVAPVGPAFRVIDGDPDVKVEDRPKKEVKLVDEVFGFNDDEDENIDVESTEGDEIERFNRLLGNATGNTESRDPAKIRQRLRMSVDIERNSSFLRSYDLSELIGESGAAGRAMTDREPLVGFDFFESRRFNFIIPTTASDPVAAESVVPDDRDMALAGIKLAFSDGEMKGAQAVFAPLRGDVLDMEKKVNSVWFGEMTNDVTTCFSNGRIINGMVIYRTTNGGILGIQLMSRK